MTPSAVRQLLLALMTVGFLFALFAKTVGLPDWSQPLGSVFAGLCAVSVLILQRRAKKRGALPASTTSDERASKRWLFIPLVVMVTLSGPLWLPLSGVTLSGPLLIVSSVISCLFCVAPCIVCYS